jgi:hypothetical protein
MMDIFCLNWTKVMMHFASLLIQVVEKAAERFLNIVVDGHKANL